MTGTKISSKTEERKEELWEVRTLRIRGGGFWGGFEFAEGKGPSQGVSEEATDVGEVQSFGGKNKKQNQSGPFLDRCWVMVPMEVFVFSAVSSLKPGR